jgi:Protein tyrosine and serine/threonine kinase
MYSNGTRPYPDVPANSAVAIEVNAGKRPTIPPVMPADVARVVQDAWATDPQSRPTAASMASSLHEISRQGETDQAAEGFSSPMTNGEGDYQTPDGPGSAFQSADTGGFYQEPADNDGSFYQ